MWQMAMQLLSFTQQVAFYTAFIKSAIADFTVANADQMLYTNLNTPCSVLR